MKGKRVRVLLGVVPIALASTLITATPAALATLQEQEKAIEAQTRSVFGWYQLGTSYFFMDKTRAAFVDATGAEPRVTWVGDRFGCGRTANRLQGYVRPKVRVSVLGQGAESGFPFSGYVDWDRPWPTEEPVTDASIGNTVVEKPVKPEEAPQVARINLRCETGERNPSGSASNDSLSVLRLLKESVAGQPDSAVLLSFFMSPSWTTYPRELSLAYGRASGVKVEGSHAFNVVRMRMTRVQELPPKVEQVLTTVVQKREREYVEIRPYLDGIR